MIAPGSVVVNSNVKKVQHPTGGVVGEVRVRDGDAVKAGDIVVRLDETVVTREPCDRDQGARRIGGPPRLEDERAALTR